MLEKIGYIENIDLAGFKAHLVENFGHLLNLYYYSDNGSDDWLRVIEEQNRHWKGSNWVCDYGDFAEWATKRFATYYSDKPEAEQFAEWLDVRLGAVKRAFEHFTSLGSYMEIVKETERFVVIKFAANRFIGVPKQFVSMLRVKDYDDYTVSDLKVLLAGGNPDASSSGALTLAAGLEAYGVPTTAHTGGIKKSTEQMRSELELAEKKAKEEYELARQEMEKKLQAMKEEHELRLSEMRENLERMKDTVFVLELNIFALRSLFGETFTLTQLASGKTSNNPLVLYQKFRFLDEEFALLAAKQFGAFDGRHGTTIEIFKNKNVQDVFLPSDKCITFFRTSKDLKYYAYDGELDGLKALDYYHEKQVGMLIRNGENIWLSFIDEEIFVEDNLFESDLTRAEADRKIKPDWKGEYDFKNDVIIQGKTRLRDPVVKRGIDRVMLFFVLEGLINSTNIFEDLKGVNVRVPSDKIIFSAADNQIGTSKYPDFKTYFQSWKEEDVRVGDSILIIERAAASRWVSGGWYGSRGTEEHRSRGYQNRARDAEDIKPGLNTISFIEEEDPTYYHLEKDKEPYKVNDDGSVIYYKRGVSAEHKGEPDVVEERHFAFYISSKRHPDDWSRRDYWGNLPSRVNNVNLRVESCEFCPVDYINSNYVRSWLEQKNIGDWYHGNYVYLVENCFHALLKMLEGREARECTMIRVHLPEFEGTPDELDAVLAWRKENKVKNFTEWQAKRFAKWYKENGGK